MTSLDGVQVDFIPRNMDSFSRLRVSNPLTLFEHNNQYGSTTFKWDLLTAGTGSITDSFTTSQTTLSTGGTAAGARAVRQARAYSRLLAGKSLIVAMSFNFGVGVAGCAKRVGYFDDNNGVFLEQNGTAIRLVIRTNFTGTPTDTAIPQSSWNVDKLDGTGPSGQVFAPTAGQNMRIDFIGTNAVRLYYHYNGVYWLVNVFEVTNSANMLPTRMPATPNLTLRKEILNLTTTASAATLVVGNCNVTGEGASEPTPTYIFSAGRGTALKAVTTRVPVFSIQAATAINSNRNYGWINPLEFNLYADAAAYYELLYNATLTGAAFSSVDSKSLANKDVAATAVSGGTPLTCGYLATGTGNAAISGVSTARLNFPLVYSSLLNTQDTLTLVATALTGTSNIGAAMQWEEYY